MFFHKTITWLIAFTFSILASQELLAQPLNLELASPQGNEVNAGAYKVNYSVGEPRVFTLSGGGYTLTEGFLQPDMFVILGGSPADSVWPGDANSDLVADMYDLLAIGIGYGKSGPARMNASNNWQAQFANNWSDSLLSGVNYKHIDCNGDGIIDENDTLAINLNYGLTHNKTTATEEENAPVLYPEFLTDSLSPGDTAFINLNLGADTMIVDSLYGIAFNVLLDTNLVEMSTLKVVFDNSWLGDKATNMITLVKSFDDGNVNIALTRTDLNNQMGYGALAQMIIMIDDLSGKNGVNEIIKVEVGNARLISRREELLPYQTGCDSACIMTDATAITHPDWDGMEVYPNPANESFKIGLSHFRPVTLRLLDMKGKEVLTSKEFIHENTIPTANIASGVYLLQLESKESKMTRKLVVKH